MRHRLIKYLSSIFYKNIRYYRKNYYYHKSFVIYNNVDSLCNLFICDSKEVIETSKYIYLNTNIEFGSTQKKVKKRLGRPVYNIKRTLNSVDFNIMQYKMYLGSYKTKLEVHFYKNTLYYYIYIFPYISSSDKETLKNLLSKKYIDGQTDICDKIIRDPKGNFLFTSESVDFSIHYLTGDKSISKEFNTLREIDKLNKQKFIKQNQEELLSRL